MADFCDDNRFELIEKYKQKLIEETNIESAPDEMKVVNDILFRFWQMGWLDKLEQPSAQPERKTGKWIELDSDEDKYDIIKCPCCKHTFTVDSYHWTDIGFVKDDFKFCPNCGTDMKGEEP